MSSQHIDRDLVEVREVIVEHLEEEIRFARVVVEATSKELKLPVDEAVIEGIRAQAKKGPADKKSERFCVRIATVPKAAAPGKQAETVMAGLIVVRTVKLRSLGEQPAAGAATPAPAAAAAAAAGSAGAGARPAAAAAAAAAAAGATAVATRGVAAPRAPLGFDLLETMNAETMGAEIVALVVLKKYRRNGVAQKLLNEALQDVLRGSPNVQVAFSFAPQNDVAAMDFFERHNFDEFGVVRSFRGSAAPYSVWAQAFHNGTLATYAGEGDELPVLGPDAALKRRRHTPRWLIELGLQFGLPVLIVVLLFGISYFLVWLGPLKGISSRYIKMAGDEGGEGDL